MRIERYKPKKEHWIWIVLFMAVVIRLVFAFQVKASPLVHGLASDSKEYIEFATRMLAGDFTHQDFIMFNPLYPVLLYLVFGVFGVNVFAAILVQVVLDILSCFMIYTLTRRLFDGTTGLVAMTIYALYGDIIFFTGVLLAPISICFLSLLFMNLLLLGVEKRKLTIFGLSGLVFGLQVLVKPNIFLFIFVVPLWIVWALRSKIGVQRAWLPAVSFLGFFLLVILGVSARNYTIEQHFSPFSTQGGLNFYIGNHSGSTGVFMTPEGVSAVPQYQVKSSIQHAEKQMGKALGPQGASDYWMKQGMEYIAENPFDFIALTLKKTTLFWHHEAVYQNVDIEQCKKLIPLLQVPFLSFGLVAPLGLLGCFLWVMRRRKEPNVLLVLLYIGVYMAGTVIFFITARFRLPVVPFLIVAGAYGSKAIFDALVTERNQKRTLGLLAVLAVCTGLVHFPFFDQGLFGKSESKYEMYNNLGGAYLQSGQIDKAIESFNQGLAINPANSELHYNLANAYLSRKELENAEKHYKKAIEYDQNNFMAFNNLGVVYLQAGFLDQAIGQFDKAVSINDEFLDAHMNRGLAYTHQTNLDEAQASFEKALRIEPDHLLANLYLGLICEEKNQLHNAEGHYTKILDKHPDHIPALKNLATLRLKQNRSQEAIEILERVVMLAPDDLGIKAQLSELKSILGSSKRTSIHD